MSIFDANKIDAMGSGKIANGKDAGKPVFMLYLIDHLEWGDETIDEHVGLLSDKLNTYVAFIRSGEYKDATRDVPELNKNFEHFEICIWFAHKLPKCYEKVKTNVCKVMDMYNIIVAFDHYEQKDEMLKAVEEYPIGSEIIVEWRNGACALCEIITRNISIGDEESFNNGINLRVEKVIHEAPDGMLKPGRFVTIMEGHRPFAIYAEDGKRLWKNKKIFWKK